MPDDQLSLDPGDVVVVAALGVEARAIEKLAERVHVVRAGVGLAALDQRLLTASVVLSVGLAGGLTDDLVSGTVVVPATVAREDGVLVACDPAWSAALERASRRLGFPTSTAPLLSADALVTHAGRARWAARGFVAADMETALLAETVARVAAVRVVLDTPHREISPAWERPGRAAMNPLLWRQGAWLMRAAPRLCRRAAMVVAAALEDARVTPFA
jgi:4-hydroxy-3-methylbut-2-en-1-yl diphosphate reductase